MGKIKPDYEVALKEEPTEEEMEKIQDQEKMKIAWCIEQDPEKKAIDIRPGSDGHISLSGVQEARHFVEVLEGIIQQMF